MQVHIAMYTGEVARGVASRFHPLRRVNLSENSIFSVSSVGGCPTGLRCTVQKKKKKKKKKEKKKEISEFYISLPYVYTEIVDLP